jgi:hypothetical protein
VEVAVRVAVPTTRVAVAVGTGRVAVKLGVAGAAKVGVRVNVGEDVAVDGRGVLVGAGRVAVLVDVRVAVAGTRVCVGVKVNVGTRV